MNTTYCPLEQCSQEQLEQLAQCLWSWRPCNESASDSHKTCVESSCPLHRSRRLVRFFQYYREVTGTYEPKLGPDVGPALRFHDDLFEVIKGIRSMPNHTRDQLTQHLSGNLIKKSKQPSSEDMECAIDLAVRVMTMVNCPAQGLSPRLLEYGTSQTRWPSDVTLSQFIANAFPMTDHPSLNDEEGIAVGQSLKSALTANKLRKRARLTFRPTDDLRSHLRLDRKLHVVEIFHHTAFLKEHLRLTKDRARVSSVAEHLKLGALPRRLALEALDSIQKILFPHSDPKSRAILRSLVSRNNFDPDCLRFEFNSIRNSDEEDVAYHYFGSRLADLYEELQNPAPYGLIEKWLERKSGARYVLLATLIGVFIAVMLGILALAVSIYQAYIGYQAWQHPVGNDGPISISALARRGSF